jgi:hypothetical protein
MNSQKETMIAVEPLSLNPLVVALQAIYGATKVVNEFVDEQIEQLKNHTDETIRASGRLLEGAKYGFGIGYITPVIIQITGQLILGNPLAVAQATLSAVSFSNPVAITCAAIGAVYFGWKALSNEERNAIIERITKAFEIGAELVKSIMMYVVTKLGDLVSEERIGEYKKFVTTAAHTFGRNLSDITHDLGDKLTETKDAIGDALHSTGDFISDKAMVIKETVSESIDKLRSA